MRTAIAQIAPRLADLEANLALHRETVDRARAAGADLVLFPELSLTGYLLMEAVPEVAIRLDSAPMDRLREISRDAAIAVGFVEESTGGRFFNSAAYLDGGEILHIHRKVYLPAHGLFDESRHFAHGDRVRCFDTRLGRVGMLVCRDSWHLGPAYLLACQDVDLMLILSASPGRGVGGDSDGDAHAETGAGTPGGHFTSVDSMPLIAEVFARSFGCHVLHANRVGVEEGVTFPGASLAFGPDGARLARGADLDEDLVLVEVDPDARRSARLRLPFLREERPHLIHRELTRVLSERAAPRF